jgi:hypothetical protein
MAAKSNSRVPAHAVPKGAKLAAVPTAAGDQDATVDRLVYERVRLGIMSALAVREELTFTELKSAHARKLEEAKYLTCSKSFERRRPKTIYRLTALGKSALNRYLDHVEAVIKATRRA